MHGLNLLEQVLTKATIAYKVIGNCQELITIIDDFISDGYVVVYLHYRVLIGRIEQGCLVFPDGKELDLMFLQQLRAFNAEKELYIRRKDDGNFALRYRIDGEGNPADIVEACQLLWGRVRQDNSTLPGWVRLSEQRGVELLLPYNGTLAQESQVRLKTRNYIGYNDVMQAGYIDTRFVEFVPEGVQ